MYGPNLGRVFWEWTCARGFWEARGWPLRAGSTSGFLSQSQPSITESKARGEPNPVRRLASSRPAGPGRLSLPARSLSVAGTHTEHSSGEPRQRAAATEELQRSSLFLGRSADGPCSRRLLFPHAPSHVAHSSALSFRHVVPLPVLWRNALFILLFTKHRGLWRK